MHEYVIYPTQLVAVAFSSHTKEEWGMEMPTTIVAARELPPLTEPAIVPDVFAVGVEPHVFTDFVRLIFWTENPFMMTMPTDAHPLEGSPMERSIVAKLVIPTPRFQLVRATFARRGLQ